MLYVPNKFPSLTNTAYRIAVIGEAPGQDEVLRGEPFVGSSGRMLKACLAAAGIQPDACFFGNVCQVRPPGNDIEAFSWEGEEFTHGRAQLAKDLQEFKPWLVVLLGKTALYAAKQRNDITNMRGSLFECNLTTSPMLGFKCLATYHPAACLRQYDWTPIFKFDLRRAAEEGKTHFLSLPQREAHICKDATEVFFYLEELERTKALCGTDIEGYVNDMQCIGFASDVSKGFVIPFRGPTGESYFSEEDELEVWKFLAGYLGNPSCPKLWQNGLYDRFIIQYTYKIPVRGNLHDTMLSMHEWQCELPKGLAFQASVLTREPYYKSERLSEDWKTKMEYCVKDACVTLESHLRLMERIQPNESARTHYLFNRDLLNPLLYMELRGMAYATEQAHKRREKVRYDMFEQQYLLDCETNCGLARAKSEQSMEQSVREYMCYKRDAGQPKAQFVGVFERAIELARKADGVNSSTSARATESSLTDSEKGELSSLLNVHCNVDSPRFTKYIYDVLKLPMQVNLATKRPTADKLALMNLIRLTDHPVAKYAAKLRKLGQNQEMLSIHADTDGRIRCGYNCVGTETGRLTCYTSPTGSGYNLTTIPKKDRDLFLADEGYWFFQCDLEGADSWTVAAWCKHLGDPTMMDDLLAGIKPAKVVVLLKDKGTSINQLPRSELKELCKHIDKDGADYYACKQVSHGANYLMGAKKTSDTILKKTEGEIYVSTKDCEIIQRLYFSRYRGVKEWHNYVGRRLRQSPTITCASGLTRRFHGRRDEILGEALAHEPQHNTTYLTNKALHNLWKDSENRRPSTDGTERTLQMSLRVQPLHQVHDALLGQFRKEDSEWAVGKIKRYFANEIIIAGQKLIVPFDGAYGESWGKLDQGKI